MREVADERQRVNQLHGINARRGIGGEIADVVRARAACVQTDTLDATQKFRSVLRLNEPHLEIRPRRDLDVTTREFPCDAREFPQLKRRQHAAGNSQPRHECILYRRQKEQAVPLETKNILLVWGFVAGGVLNDLPVSVERMQLAFHAFLENQIPVLRRWLDIAELLPAHRHTSEQAGKIFLLLRRESGGLDGLW